MKKWKIAFFVCFSLLIVSTIYLSYQLLDSEITITYTSDTIDKQDKVIRLLGEILAAEGEGYSKKDVLFLLRQNYPNGFIVEDSNRVSYEGVEFRFENDSLKSVSDTW